MATKSRNEIVVGRGALRRRLFHRTVRAGVRMALERKGHSDEEVERLMSKVTDDMIDDGAEEHNIKAPGDGTFLDWLKEHGPQIMELVKMIMSILSMFA